MRSDSSEALEHPVNETLPTIPEMHSSHSQTFDQSVQKNNQLPRIDPRPRQSLPGSSGGQGGAEAIPGSAVTLIIQEMDELRAQMVEVVRRQQLESSRESRLLHLIPSEEGDGRTAPPAYSDRGR